MSKKLTNKQMGNVLLQGFSRFKYRAGDVPNFKAICTALRAEGVSREEVTGGFKYLEARGYTNGDKHIITEAGYKAIP